jgi:hypothetical protein
MGLKLCSQATASLSSRLSCASPRDSARVARAMHQIFRISEICRLIFDNLVYTIDDKRVGLVNVRSVALTCKALAGPALDLLWEELLDFTHLFKTLPSDLWKLESQESFDSKNLVRYYNVHLFKAVHLNTFSSALSQTDRICGPSTSASISVSHTKD